MAAPKLKLRPTILGWFTGLLLLTVLSIGGFAYHETRETLDFLTAQHLESVAHSTRAEVRHLLAPAPRILTELELLASEGVLPEHDTRALGMVFVERMRQNPEIGWLGYANRADRSFTGGTRSSHHGLRWYRSDPAVNGGVSTEFAVNERGQWSPESPASPDPYDPTTRPWFQEALEHPELRWLEPYQFTDGQWGMSVTQAVVRDGEIVGVLLADYFLADLTQFLSKVEVGRTGRVEILTRDGLVLGDSEAHIAELLTAMSKEGVHQLDVLGAPHRVTWEPFVIDGGLDWNIAVIVPESELSGVATRNAWRTLQVGLIALILALLSASWFARAVSRPIREMSAMMERIARLDIPETEIPASPIAEIHTMALAMGSMKAGLSSFARYVPVSLVRLLLDRGVAAKLGAEPHRITVMFSDIAGFTPLLESTPPAVVVEALGDYLEKLGAAITAHDGVVSQYLGDGILAYWGTPIPAEDHEVRACLAVLAMRDASRALARQAQDRGAPLLHTRFGINTGDVLVGNIGSPERFNYTALGDSVNTAARIEGLNKVYGTEVLLGEATAARIAHAIVTRPIDRVRMKGKLVGVLVYELIGEVGKVDEETLDRVRIYTNALSAYQARDFTSALALFEQLDDAPSRVQAARCRESLERPPSADWDGTARMHTK